jgi:hypothetical protein
MNKRIKEIAEQVEKYISTTNFEGMPEDVMTYDEIFQKKFAELIVRECAEFVDYRLTNPDGASMAWCDGSDIKQHFGVEE